MRNLLFLLFFIVGATLFSQPSLSVDSLSITLAQAEEQFVKNNYELLAQKYNVDAAKAMVRQAGLFNNPNLYYEQSIYNRYSGKYFPTETGTWGNYATQGEFVVQYNWLFNIAGKRNKQVKVAKARADVAQYEFDDLVRTLVYALRSDFYELYYGLNSLQLFGQQINSLSNIVAGFEIQYKNGNTSLRELTRVRALLLSLQSERLALFSELQEVNKEFSVLLNNAKPTWYKPTVNETEVISRYTNLKLSFSDLNAQALQYRPDLKAAQAELASAEANLKLQKAMAVPDITAQGVFDRNGSYIPNYNAVALSVPIAIFNRNQGNIGAAKAGVEASNQLLLQKQTSVQNDVLASFQKILETEKLGATVTSDFTADFNSILSGAKENYEKKNLSLIEFVDLFQSYKEAAMQQNKIKAQRINAYEELNFSVGKDLFNK
jgi:cobalt-zinc-cadmium efflux system outer membrane protein